MIWPRSHFESEDEPAPEEDEAVEEEAEAPSNLPPEAVPPEPASLELRNFALLVQKNEVVKANRKLAVSAATLPELTEKICSSFPVRKLEKPLYRFK